jgi:hypothetical protein
VTANVGLFVAVRQPALAPDVMLSLDVRAPDNLFVRENRSYLLWVIQKVPEVVIELVSDRRGGEDSYKLQQYALAGIQHYVIFDPANHLEAGVLRAWRLDNTNSLPVSPAYFPMVGLGVTLWQGEFEGHHDTWLRWCDQQGQVIPTGRERAERERELAERERERADSAEERAKSEKQRADSAEERVESEKQRADSAKERAESEKQRADSAEQRADSAEERADKLAARLRELGIDPET